MHIAFLLANVVPKVRNDCDALGSRNNVLIFICLGFFLKKKYFFFNKILYFGILLVFSHGLGC